MTTRVVGLDVSTSTGLALPDGSLTRLRLRTGPDDPGRRFHELAEQLERSLRRYPPAPDLAVLEGPSLHGPGVAGKLTSAGLRAVCLLRLFELGVPAILVEPTRLKRYATGNGNADKAAMVAAAVEDGATPANDDEADAYWLRHLGRAGISLDPDVLLDRPHRIEVVAAIDWSAVR